MGDCPRQDSKLVNLQTCKLRKTRGQSPIVFHSLESKVRGSRLGETLCHWRTLIAFAIGRLGDSKTPKLPIAKARKALQLVQKCFCALPCRPKAASASVRDGKPKAHRGEAALAEAPASGPCAVAPRWIASAIAVTHGFSGRAQAPPLY